MPKIKIVVIEDEFFAANHLKSLITDLGYWVVGVYHSAEVFLEETDWKFDAAVVDIFLSESLTGLDVGAQMKEHKKPFIFLTANQDARTLKDAARLAPAAYISKPFKPNDVSAALQIISHSMPDMLQIRGTYGMEELNPNDLLFVKSDGVYIEMHTINGMTVQRKLLKEIIDELPESFVRVHRSYVVNSDFIEHRTATSVMVRGHEVPVSRSYRESV